LAVQSERRFWADSTATPRDHSRKKRITLLAAVFTPAASYRFGPYVLDATAYRLTHAGQSIALSPKALDLLFLFAGRPGALVTKDGILAALWPDVAVTDNALTQVVSEVRQALGDSPVTPTYVQTVPRRGYRFVASVATIAPALAASADAALSGAATRADAAGPPMPEAPKLRAIAVLDFVNMSGDGDVQWLSAGIAETITNALRAVRDVRVIDRATMAAALEGARPAPGDVVISGGVQRAGATLRITAQALDAVTRQAVAHAKTDGPIDDVFALQDGIVAQLVAGLRMTVGPAAQARMRARETASLEAYRALTEGRLKLETLDPALVPAATKDFERAIQLDPAYAVASVGLAHAAFWRFQASRARNRPDNEALAQAIAHARHAVDLDSELAEGHAALALFLASADRPREAVSAGRVATALEPANWRHLFRLGIAAWGDERVDCLDNVLRVFPQLTYASFALAMVHVARGAFDQARRLLEAGIAAEAKRPIDARFPSAGLHWLLGLIVLAQGDVASAEQQFEHELGRKTSALFADEYAMDAWHARGLAHLSAGRHDDAAAMFARALERYPAHARSLVGLADAHRRAGRTAAAGEAIARAKAAIDELRTSGREAEAAIATAHAQTQDGRASDAIATLARLIDHAPPGLTGWTLPVEPFTAPLRSDPAFRSVLERIAARAR
jgi:DNA-binding winged helix-turn-helix (wHTH) protein/tetratricopeptide (TPR) repeat protein